MSGQGDPPAGRGGGDAPASGDPNAGFTSNDPVAAMAAAIRAQREAQEQAARLVETQQAAMRAAALGGMSPSQYAAMSAMVLQQQQERHLRLQTQLHPQLQILNQYQQQP